MHHCLRRIRAGAGAHSEILRRPGRGRGQVEAILIDCDPNGVPYLSFMELMQQATTDVAAGLEILPYGQSHRRMNQG